MFDSQQNLDTLLEKYQTDLDRLRRLLRCMHSVSDIRYIYDYLSNLKPETTHEFIMHVEAVTTGLVIGYGRLFTSAEGTTKIDEDKVPKHLLPIHQEIMSLRHERYAHHGGHGSIQTQIDVRFDGTAFILEPRLNII